MATIDNLSIQVTANAESAASALDRLASSAGGLRGAAAKAGGGLRDLSAGAKDAGTETSKAGTQAEKLGSIFQVLGNTSKNGASNIATFWHSITGAVGAISRITGVSGFAQDALGMLGKSFAGIGQAISKYGIMGLPKFFGDELVSSIKKPIAAIGNFVAGIKRIAYYRIIRTIIKEITQAINEGMKSLYAWSKTADGTFKKTMNGLAASTQYLGNSFAAMISPLINALSPAIDFIVDKFVDMFNTISQIIARLTGQTSYTAAKKVAAQWGDASKSAGKSAQDAADKIKRTILGFDEINKLNGKTDTDSGSGGGGSGGGAAGMFETLPIEGEIVSFADMLKNAFIHGEWHTLGTLLGDKINEMVDSIDWAGTGETVGWYINGWFSTKYWTLDTINFTNIGSKIAEFLNSMIGQIDFNILGRLMVQKFTIVFDMVIGFIETFDWGQAGEKLSKFATGVFQELSKWLQKTDWVKLGESIVNGIVAFFGSADYSGLAKSASEFLGSALGAAVGLITGLGKAIGEKIGEAFNGIGEFFNEQIEACGGDIVGGILRGIIVGLVNIGVWIVENIFQPFINGFKAAFGIASPAKTMEEPGKNIVLGIFQGIINALMNIGTWVKENIFDPIWNAIKAAGATVIEIAVSLVKKVGEWASDVWDFLQNTGATIAKKVTAAFEAAKSFAGDVWDFVKTGAQTIVKTVNAIFTEVGTWAGNVWDTVKAGAETIVKEVKAIFTEVGTWAGNVWNAVKAGAETIVKTVNAIFSEVGTWAGSVWNAVKNGAETILKTVQAIFTEVGTWAGNVWNAVKAGAETIVKTIQAIFTTIGSWAGDAWNAIQKGKETIAKTIQAAFTTIGSWAGDAWNAIQKGKETIVKTIEAAMSFASSWVSGVFDFVSNTVTVTKNVILSVVDNFTEAVKKMFNFITNKDNKYKVEVDAYGNMQVVPVSGNGLTVTGSGNSTKVSLTNDISGNAKVGLTQGWSGTPTSAMGLEGLSATVSIGVSLLWATVGILAYLALTNLKTDVTVGLKIGWEGTALSALNISELATKVTVSLKRGWEGTALSALNISELATTVTVSLKRGWKGTALSALNISELATTVTVSLKRGWKGTALSALNLSKLATKVTVSLKKGWSGTALSDLNISKLSTKVTVDLKRGWSGTALSELNLSGLETKVKVKLEKGSPNKIKVSQDGDEWKLEVKKLGGVFANGIWKNIPQYASGTTNAHGSMFLAGEAGPELVGHLGGRTEVLNQSQLAQTMFAAVRSAMTGVKIGGYIENAVQTDNGDADYETMYRAMYDAFTDAMTGSNERDKEKVALMRQIAAKEFTAEVTAASMNRAQTRMNRRAGTTIVPVGT